LNYAWGVISRNYLEDATNLINMQRKKNLLKEAGNLNKKLIENDQLLYPPRKDYIIFVININLCIYLK